MKRTSATEDSYIDLNSVGSPDAEYRVIVLENDSPGPRAKYLIENDNAYDFVKGRRENLGRVYHVKEIESNKIRVRQIFEGHQRMSRIEKMVKKIFTPRQDSVEKMPVVVLGSPQIYALLADPNKGSAEDPNLYVSNNGIPPVDLGYVPFSPTDRFTGIPKGSQGIHFYDIDEAYVDVDDLIKDHLHMNISEDEE